MLIDPRHLRYLLAIARAGSFSKAAAALAISQPALSTSIQRLETVTGATLFERSRHGATLTHAGELLLRHAERMEKVLTGAEEELRLNALSVRGPLTVGGTPLAVMGIIPAAVARLSHDHGPVRVNICEGGDEELLERLLKFELDVLVSTIDLGVTHPLVCDVPLFKAGLFVVVRPGHPLAGRESLTLRELEPYQLVLPHPSGAYTVQLESTFVASGARLPEAVVYTSSFAILKEVVIQSDAVTLVPRQIVRSDLERRQLVRIPIEEPVGLRTFGMRLIKDRKLSGTGARFVEHLKELAPDFA